LFETIEEYKGVFGLQKMINNMGNNIKARLPHCTRIANTIITHAALIL